SARFADEWSGGKQRTLADACCAGRGAENETSTPDSGVAAAALPAQPATGHFGVAGRAGLVFGSDRTHFPGHHGDHRLLEQTPGRNRAERFAAYSWATGQQVSGLGALPGPAFANLVSAAG